jgi:outer membrane protein assembly factor BamB
MGRGEMQPVELVAGDAPGGPVDAPGHPAAASASPGHRLTARGRRRVLAGVLAVGLALAGTQAVLDARERDHLARLGAVPGVLAPLGDGIEARWTSDGAASHVVRTGTRAGDLWVGTYVGDDGVLTVRAISPATGAEVWSIPVNAPGARATGVPSEFTRSSGPGCEATTGDGDAVVVCLVADAPAEPAPDPGELDGGPSDGGPGDAEPTTATVLVLDARTGEVLARRTTTSGARLVVLGDLLVLARPDEDGHLLVTGEDPTSGAQRWRFRTSEPLAYDRLYGVLLSAWRTGEHVQVAEAQGRTWLLSADGTLVHATADGLELAWPESLRGGRIGLVSYAVDGSTVLLTPDGARGPTLDGVPAFVSVDDGSAPGLLLTTASRFHAWDATTGESVWESDALRQGAVPWSNIVLLDGTLYGANAAGRLVAVDAATGRTLWQRAFDANVDTSLHTDGRVLLVAELSGGERRLAAFDRADGARVWSAPLPAGVSLVLERGGQLFGMPDYGSSTLVSLG